MKMIFLLMLFFTFALGIDYQVVVEDDSTELEQNIQAAFEKWSDGTDFQANLTADANTFITYGTQNLLGPDVVSLSISKLVEGKREVNILFTPTSELLPSAYLHEVGILAGLPITTQGIMNPKLSQESPIELTDADKKTLTNRASSSAEDINHDGTVDFYDLFEFSKAFGSLGIGSSADINEDGQVNEEDLSLLEKAYTFSNPARTRGQNDAEVPTGSDSGDQDTNNQEIDEQTPVDWNSEEVPEAPDPNDPINQDPNNSTNQTPTNNQEDPNNSTNQTPNNSTDKDSDKDSDKGSDKKNPEKKSSEESEQQINNGEAQPSPEKDSVEPPENNKK